MKFLKPLFILLLFIPFFANCQSPTTNLKSLSSTEFQKILLSEDVLLVDVRTPSEFNAGHIKAAKNIDVNNPDFAKQIKSSLNKKNLALYCRSGNRSKYAASKLANLGINMYELNYGFNDWVKNNLPVEY